MLEIYTDYPDVTLETKCKLAHAEIEVAHTMEVQKEIEKGVKIPEKVTDEMLNEMIDRLKNRFHQWDRVELFEKWKDTHYTNKGAQYARLQAEITVIHRHQDPDVYN